MIACMSLSRQRVDTLRPAMPSVEGIDLGRLVGGDFHADADLGDNRQSPLHDANPSERCFDKGPPAARPPEVPDEPLVEGIDLGRLVGGDFHADADFGDNRQSPLHDASPRLSRPLIRET
jgi:hypothetical protein